MMRGLLLVGVLSMAACMAESPAASAAGDVAVSGGSVADRERMAEISKDWLDAYASGDLEALMAIMHDDAMVMPHNQPTSHGLDEVREFFAGRIGRPGVTFRDNLQEIRINGDWAYVLGTFSLEIASEDADQPPFVHNGRYLVLYEKVDGDWKMLRDMDNAVPVGN